MEPDRHCCLSILSLNFRRHESPFPRCGQIVLFCRRIGTMDNLCPPRAGTPSHSSMKEVWTAIPPNNKLTTLPFRTSLPWLLSTSIILLQETKLMAFTQWKNEGKDLDLLPPDFEPGEWDVICQRGKECYDHGKIRKPVSVSLLGMSDRLPIQYLTFLMCWLYALNLAHVLLSTLLNRR